MEPTAPLGADRRNTAPRSVGPAPPGPFSPLALRPPAARRGWRPLVRRGAPTPRGAPGSRKEAEEDAEDRKEAQASASAAAAGEEELQSNYPQTFFQAPRHDGADRSRP